MLIKEVYVYNRRAPILDGGTEVHCCSQAKHSTQPYDDEMISINQKCFLRVCHRIWIPLL